LAGDAKIPHLAMKLPDRGHPAFVQRAEFRRSDILTHTMKRIPVAMMVLSGLLLGVCAGVMSSRAEAPDWCKSLPRAGYKTLKRVPIADTWFEVYEVAPATFAIYEPKQSEETVGYLIVGRKRALLFDSGMGIGDIKAVVDRLTSLPVSVLNSHTHGDHVGGNWQFQDVYGMDTEFTRKNARGSSEQAQEEIKPSELCGALPAGFDPKTYVTRPWKITHLVRDGDKIDLGGREIEVIATPGHTPDAISLFERGRGLLFTGDTYYPGTIYLFAPETDLDAYGKSIARLAALAPQVREVLGAHNFPLTPPAILPKLVADFAAVRAGKVAGKPAGPGRVIYKAESVSFLMQAGK
jgi:glyoxylase-like metal-dependent hydrolase (beta-lactamase superfamily II)